MTGGGFVGRERELALLEDVADGLDGARVAYVHGPGGVGKSAVLRHLAAPHPGRASRMVYVDLRDLAPLTPERLLEHLAGQLDVGPTLSAVGAAMAGRVLLLDTYRRREPLDGWLRDSLLPALERTAVVVAGRAPPSADWRADERWRREIVPVPLRNFSAAEVSAYLRARGVPAEQHADVATFTHGHPLALALVSDVIAQRPGVRFDPLDAPDVIRALVDRLVQHVPGPAHRGALEACALVHALTEPLLAAMLAVEDAHELFTWLRGLSALEAGPHGLALTDVAREVLAAEVRWRNPDWYAELHRRAREYFVARIHDAAGENQQRALLDLLHLHRDNPVVRPFFAWSGQEHLWVDGLHAGDRAVLEAAVARHEGHEAGHLAAAWLAQSGQDARLLRDADGGVAGFVLGVDVGRANGAPPDDPALARVHADLARWGGLRPGEVALLFRWWLAVDRYQDVSPVQSRLFVEIVRQYLVTPRLARSWLVVADPDFWEPVLTYADLERVTAGAFELGGRAFGMFAHDWRQRPPAAWLSLLAERELASGPVPPPAPPPPVVALGLDAFATAVRDVLRHLDQPDDLAPSPLLDSRLVCDLAGTGADTMARVAVLRAAITEAVAALAATPRGVKLHRAVHHTYVQPAPTQERAAELLGLPFTTYRRHLRQGVGAVTEWLWRREVGEIPLPRATGVPLSR